MGIYQGLGIPDVTVETEHVALLYRHLSLFVFLSSGCFHYSIVCVCVQIKHQQQRENRLTLRQQRIEVLGEEQQTRSRDGTSLLEGRVGVAVCEKKQFHRNTRQERSDAWYPSKDAAIDLFSSRLLMKGSRGGVGRWNLTAPSCTLLYGALNYCKIKLVS